MPPAGTTDLSKRDTNIDGLVVITTKRFDDDRGTIREIYRESALAGGESPLKTVAQVNLTFTRYGAIRGLHGEAMTKLVGVASGRAFGAYVDARPGSPTRGNVFTLDLEPGIQVLVPSGVCNGFQCVSEEGSLYLYCFDAEWVAGMAGVAVNPLDPELAIPWPVAIDPLDRSLVSEKDFCAQPFSALGAS